MYSTYMKEEALDKQASQMQANFWKRKRKNWIKIAILSFALGFFLAKLWS